MTLRSGGATAATELDGGHWERPTGTRLHIPPDPVVLLGGLVCFGVIMVATSNVAWSTAGVAAGASGGLVALFAAWVRLFQAFDDRTGRLPATANALVGVVLAVLAVALPLGSIPTRVAFGLSRAAFDQAAQQELQGADVKPGRFGVIDIDQISRTATGDVEFDVDDAAGDPLGSFIYSTDPAEAQYGWDLGQGWWLTFTGGSD